jgi:hypothetical protein
VNLPPIEDIHAAIAPLARWAYQCHAASLALVNSGVLPGSRVARGSCKGVMGQHSWVVVGHDVYARDAVIVDPTLWSYDPSVAGIWTGSARDGRHVPHGGTGTIWTWGKPEAQGGPIVELTPKTPLSRSALMILDMIGPLDYHGWCVLADAPVHGWPAAEIVAAIDDTEALASCVPIDILGMLTDRNPGGLYLPTAEPEPDTYVVEDARDLLRLAGDLSRRTA